MCRLNNLFLDKLFKLLVHAAQEEQKLIKNMGATMRLGAYECSLIPESRTWEAYGKVETVHERHRHRYEFNNDYTITDWLMGYSPVKDITYVRGFLGRMLFAGEDGVKKVKVLSGGEKVRCLLSKMMISGANIIILDEPTNHLDMESITALNNGLIKFPGVILFASHDHQFVETTANRIMEILPNGTLIDKITTYDEYLESDEMARKRQTLTVNAEEEELTEE